MSKTSSFNTKRRKDNKKAAAAAPKAASKTDDVNDATKTTTTTVPKRPNNNKNATTPTVTFQEKIAKAHAEKNAKRQKQMFVDVVLSKEFDAILEEVYAACSSATERGGGGGRGSEGGQKLDAAELNVAIKATRAKLEAIAGEDLKLPEVRESVEDILEKFDENNDGFLDKREFQAFARTYFSRVEWPMWKTAAKGAAKGVGIHVFMQCVVAPIVALCSPLIIAFAHNEMKKITGEHLDTMKNEVAKKFHSINVFGKDEDGDGINDDVERIERKQKWQRRMKKARDAAAPAAVASAAACAGLM